MSHVAVVGGGQAAASVVGKLRALGFEGRLSVFSAEAHPPYERPPLSKRGLTDADVGDWR